MMPLDLFTAFFIGFITSSLILCGVNFCYASKQYRIRKVLGIVLIFFGLMLSKDILYILDDVQRNEFVYNVLVLVDNWAVAFGCLYVLELLRPGYVTLRTSTYHLIGYVFLTFLYILTADSLVYKINFFFAAVYVISNFIFLVYSVLRYRNMLKQMYSQNKSISVNWIWFSSFTLLFLFFYWVFSATKSITIYDLVYYTIMYATWNFVVYKTKRLPALEVEDVIAFGNKEHLEEKMVIEQGLPEGMLSTQTEHREHYPFSEKLNELISNGYFSEHPQLTLVELASELNTNRTTLSTYINRELNTTFYDLVNEVRISVTEKYLRDPDVNLTQDELAFKSGFNSTSTFKRAFYKKYQMTPAQFKRKNLKKLQ